jgi:Trypsin-like peptidase domain/Effector-associated domain 1
VTHFLDETKLDLNDPAARDLWNLLASVYQSKPEVRDLSEQAGLDNSEFNWDQPMRWVWRDILTLAHRRGRLRLLLEQIRHSGDTAVAARIDELVAPLPVTTTPAPAPDATWKGFGDPALEKVIQAEPTFLDIAFLRRGVELGAAVCRLLVTMSGQHFVGTGFRIGGDLILTNHHVLFDRDHGNAPATAVEAWFGYERTFAGLDLAPTVVNCDPASIVGAADHDWAVVRTTDAMPADAPVIELTGAAPVRVDDRVYIIQHPSGAPKKIGMIHNVVRSVDDDVVQYLTDTEGGSSGSPVFNEQWGLVALHHQWVEATTNGVTEIRNQGRRIERVVAGLQAAQVI